MRIRICVILVYLLSLVPHGAAGGLVLCRESDSRGIHMEARHSACPQESGDEALPPPVTNEDSLVPGESSCEDISLDLQALTNTRERDVQTELSRSPSSVARNSIETIDNRDYLWPFLERPGIDQSTLILLSSTILLI